MSTTPVIRFKSVLPEFTVQQVLTAEDIRLVATQINLDHDKNLNILLASERDGVFVDTVTITDKGLTASEENGDSFPLIDLGDWFIVETHSNRNAVIGSEYDTEENLITQFDSDLIPEELLTAIVVPA